MGSTPLFGDKTVDHFKPKIKHPSEAYQWANFRLACRTINTQKKGVDDVLDPFTLQAGWFVLDFDAYMVKLGAGLSPAAIELVEKTIKRLGLNSDVCIQTRQSWLEPYIAGETTFGYLRKRAPFIANELERQGLVEAIRSRRRFPHQQSF